MEEVKEVVNEEVKKSKKGGGHKGLLIVLLVIVAFAAIATVFMQKSTVKSVTDTTDVQYQYQKIDPSKILVDYGFKGTKPLDQISDMYTLSVPSYSSDMYTVFINEQPFDIKCNNYVESESVKWLYNGKETIPSNVSAGPVDDPSVFTSTITYSDGTTLEGMGEYAEISWDNPAAATVTIYVGGTTYMETFQSEGATVTVESTNNTGTVESVSGNDVGITEESDNTTEAIDGEEVSTGFDFDSLSENEQEEIAYSLGFNSVEDYKTYMNTGVYPDYMQEVSLDAGEIKEYTPPTKNDGNVMDSLTGEREEN